jgi:hypothetical protein
MNTVCPKCLARLQPEQTVVLWDGNAYCRSCLDTTDSGLATYAARHGVLEETMPDCRRQQVRLFGGIFVVLWFLFGSSMFFSQPAPRNLFDALESAFAALVLCGIAFVLVTGSHVMRAKWGRPTIRVHDGKIEIHRGKSDQVVECDLLDCRWHVGKAKQDDALPSSISGSAVLIEYPVQATSVRRRKVACGWTGDMRTIWISFLTLAGVPRK